MKTIAVLAAAGRGERLESDRAKLWATVASEPLIRHALACVEGAEVIDGVIVMTPPSDADSVRENAERWGFAKVTAVLGGGERRQDTVRIALDALPEGCEIVAVHDAARPMASPELFRRVVEAARRKGAATAAVRPVDTVARSEQNGTITYLDRTKLNLIQTPQAFKVEILKEAHERAQRECYEGTDDAGLVLQAGFGVELVEGEADNFKVTYPLDLLKLEAFLKSRNRR